MKRSRNQPHALAPSPPHRDEQAKIPPSRVEHPADAITHTINSEFEQAVAIRDAFLEAVQAAGYDDSARFGVQLAFDEAIANAIIHGNGRNPEAHIDITYLVNDDGLYLSIQDEGPGFEPDDVDDPTRDENLEIPAGRGLFLMRAYMTSIEYNAKGNAVVMKHDRCSVG